MSLTVRPAEDVPETTPQPVAYISGYHKGRCIIEAVDRNVLLPVGMALYRSPPTREPLTEEQIEFRFGRKPTKYMMFLIRSTERAHGIGGEE